MIDRRTFLARSSVATALAAVGIHQETPAVLPATIEHSPAVDPSHAFFAHISAYDSQREAFMSANMQIWTTANGCAVVMDDGQGGERCQIVFDQPQVVWAFTCLARLMQSQGSYQASDDR